MYRINNFRIGGQPGELPTVLIGNIFYKGMPEVSNHREGSFDKKTVLKWIRLAETISEKSGVPHFLDIMAMYPEAIRRYIAFVSEQTNTPFLIDGANPETRIAALDTVKQLNLEKYVIFNGITPKTSQNELVAIKDAGVNAAVAMAFNEFDYSPEGRISILEGSTEYIGLLGMAKKAKVEKILIDTIVFDVPSISYAAEAIKLVKEQLGYPAGCSPANAMYSWKQALKGSVLREGFAASNASAHTIAQCWGADFLIYGPIKQAKNMIPACAVNDAIIAYYTMKRFGTKPLVKNHPLYKIF
ncbi:MAG: tetrahydromethanopterin S-methyltransferase subunit H [Candidatus Bathyarchaeota archaeon]|nr:tetrahydromethanopterin S-methyltransferase subunit H [Candidatus Bathyarchaeota archaeon]